MEARRRHQELVVRLFRPIDRASLRPEFYFNDYGFEWVRPWRGNGMYVHFGVSAASAPGPGPAGPDTRR